ncbi:MAG: alpha/beta fold hydrolase [Calothrix sp. SM1_7_51]|nr:alpha/beta fold hydrolase [Calothrix sp. SM1_7_51]
MIEEESDAEAKAQPFVNNNSGLDLREKGSFIWQKETLNFNDNTRKRDFIGDLYLPQSQAPVPVLIISHGVADNRNTFAYLGEYLASYGFAVVALEHPGSNTQQFQNLLLGAAKEAVETPEFIDRPQDVSFVINELTSLNQNSPQIKDKLNLQQIGIIGHSFGGYTALAIAGAKFDFAKLKRECRADNYNLNAANASLLLQCLALNLPANVDYKLQDKRIKAVFVMNPSIGSIFGEKGLSAIELPVMLLGGSDDAVTPHLLEQVCPFTWLKTPDKYLVKIQGGTHVYDNQGLAGAVPLPSPLANPDPLLSQKYIQIMTLAFAKTYVANDPQYRQFLSPSYVQTISKPSLPIQLVRLLTAKTVI